MDLGDVVVAERVGDYEGGGADHLNAGRNAELATFEWEEGRRAAARRVLGPDAFRILGSERLLLKTRFDPTKIRDRFQARAPG